MKEEIEEIRKDANNKIYYIIFDRHKELEKDIIDNFNMGLISFHERLIQISELYALTIKKFKENGIVDTIR